MSYYHDDLDDEDKKQYKQYEIREGIVFLIEVSPAILAPRSELKGKSQLFEILSSINQLMTELIITMRSTGVGVYLYNCSKIGSLRLMKSTPGFNRLFRLNYLNLSNMKLLNDIIQDDISGVRKLDYHVKYEKPAELENLPAIFNKIIDELNYKKEFNRKKVLWFTTNDKPYTKNSTKENLWRIINDYYNYGYFIRPIFLSDSSSNFNMSLFQDIFLNTNYLNKDVQNDQTDRDNVQIRKNPLAFKGFRSDSTIFKKTVVGDQIRKSIFRVKEVRRIQFACDLILSDGADVGGMLGCSVKGYTLCSHEKYKKDLMLYTRGETLKRVFVDSKLLDLQTGEPVETQGSKTVSGNDVDEEEENVGSQKLATLRGHPISGGEVLLLNEEIAQFLSTSAFDHTPDGTNVADKDDEDELENEAEEKPAVPFTKPPYLKLLGFRDLDRFNPAYNSQSAIFVSPDLSDGLQTNSSKGGFQNSFTTFSSLYQSCVRLKKYGVVFGCIRPNAKPSMYALYPTRVENSMRKIDDGPDFPEGFMLIRTPWLDDIRGLPNHFLENTANQFTSDEDDLTVDADLVYDIKKLSHTFFYDSYNPNNFPSPSLNYFYKIIKHDLLQIELSDEDRKLVNNDALARQLDVIRAHLQSNPESAELFRDLNSRLTEIDSRAPKRGLEESSKPTAKRPNVPELDEEAVLVAWKNDEWHRFTVAQLRGFQRTYKDHIKLATKKQDLVDNIKAFLESKEKLSLK